jgi:hypothetical protein
MKKSLLIAAVAFASCAALAQEPPKPVWMDSKPSARGLKFTFFTASGRGATPEEAREAAFATAYAEGLQASGMTVASSGQTLSDIKAKGVDAYIEGTNGHAVAIYCEERVRITEDRYIAYVLIQMARSANQNPFFEDAEDLGDICKKKEFAERKEKYRQLREQQQVADQKKQSSFWKYHHNSYFSFTLGNGMTYGKLGGLSFSGRHGGLLGVGYHVSAGLSVEYSKFDTDYGLGIPGYIHYSAGVKFYYYKYFYLGANYGIVEVEQVPAISGAAWRTEGYKVHHAPSFMAGVDFCKRRFILGVGAGLAVKPDASVLPAWSFGLGFTF